MQRGHAHACDDPEQKQLQRLAAGNRLPGLLALTRLIALHDE